MAAPKVKKLVWEDCHAETDFGTYDFGRVGGIWTLRLDGVQIETGVESNFTRAAGAAKEAAQSHHEGRILNALQGTS